MTRRNPTVSVSLSSSSLNDVPTYRAPLFFAVFCHQTAIQSTGFRLVREGERVAYEVTQGERGVQAVSVTAEDGKPFDRSGEDAGPGYGGGGGDRRPREGGFRREGGGGGGYRERSGPPRERRERRDSRGDGDSQ